MRLEESKKNKIRMTCVFILTAIISMTVCFFQGCQKASHNGDLDGQWQVMEVLHGDEPISRPEDQRYYYNFYLHTFQLGYTDMRYERLVGNMVYERNHLMLTLPFVIEDKVKPEWVKRLVFWGMPASGEADMQILELNSSRLVMRHDSVTIICRKF